MAATIIVYSSRLKKDDELVPRSVRIALTHICTDGVSVCEHLAKSIGCLKHLIHVDLGEDDTAHLRRGVVQELERLFSNGDASQIKVEFGPL